MSDNISISWGGAQTGPPRRQALSLAIPCFNAGRFLPLTLAGVACLQEPPSEVLVLDDGSNDQTQEVAEFFSPYFEHLLFVRSPENRGLAATRNRALVEASGELLAWLDADCCPDKSWLQTLNAVFVAGKASDMPLAVVMGSLVERQARGSVAGWRQRHLGQQAGAAGPAGIFYGSNFLCDRQVILASGGFSEQYRTNYEDIDLSCRLGRRGLLIFHEPAAKAYHAKHLGLAEAFRSFAGWQRAARAARADGLTMGRKEFLCHLTRQALAVDFGSGHPADLLLSLAMPAYLATERLGSRFLRRA